MPNSSVRLRPPKSRQIVTIVASTQRSRLCMTDRTRIELLREKEITSEETTKVYETLLQMLTQNSNEAKGLHNQELGKQFDRLAVKTKKCIWEQVSCKAGVEDIQARLETYAQENQSLKEKVDEQEATITALKEENCNFKMLSYDTSG